MITLWQDGLSPLQRKEAREKARKVKCEAWCDSTRSVKVSFSTAMGYLNKREPHDATTVEEEGTKSYSECYQRKSLRRGQSQDFLQGIIRERQPHRLPWFTPLQVKLRILVAVTVGLSASKWQKSSFSNKVRCSSAAIDPPRVGEFYPFPSFPTLLDCFAWSAKCDAQRFCM